MNEAIVKILTDAADQLAAAATSCQSCKHVENPNWLEAVDLIDGCTDELREFVQKLEGLK
jgi:hypothetical protein